MDQGIHWLLDKSNDDLGSLGRTSAIVGRLRQKTFGGKPLERRLELLTPKRLLMQELTAKYLLLCPFVIWRRAE